MLDREVNRRMKRKRNSGRRERNTHMLLIEEKIESNALSKKFKIHKFYSPTIICPSHCPHGKKY